MINSTFENYLIVFPFYLFVVIVYGFFPASTKLQVEQPKLSGGERVSDLVKMWVISVQNRTNFPTYTQFSINLTHFGPKSDQIWYPLHLHLLVAGWRNNFNCTGSDINNAPSINYKLFRFVAFKHNGTVYHWKPYSNCDPNIWKISTSDEDKWNYGHLENISSKIKVTQRDITKQSILMTWLEDIRKYSTANDHNLTAVTLDKYDHWSLSF